MAAVKRPKPPTNLGEAGSTLWTSIVGDLNAEYELDARELHTLERACRCADELTLLEAVLDEEGLMTIGSKGQRVVHPALSEARQLRLVQSRLLAQVELIDAEREEKPTTPASARGRKAAGIRWDAQRRREAVRHG